MSKQKWLLLPLDDGWQAVLPDTDTAPHATIVRITPDGEKDADLAWWDCPCKPTVHWKDKILVHNSFQESAPPEGETKTQDT